MGFQCPLWDEGFLALTTVSEADWSLRGMDCPPSALKRAGSATGPVYS